MEDVKLVIKIPEEDYKKIIEYGECDYLRIINAIENGIVLPKGHGRLIDADVLEKDMVNGIKAGLYEEGYETFAHINDMDDCVECVKYADTIIEADEEKE